MVDPVEPRSTRGPTVALVALAAALAVVVVAWLGFSLISLSEPPPPSAAAAVATPSESGGLSATPDGGSPRSSGPLASVAPPTVTGEPPRVGSIAVVDAAGALSVIAPDGRSVVLSDPASITVGFPAWSPDGTHVAAVLGADGATTIDVFPIDASAATAGPPVAIYRSSIQQAFYLSWTPGGRSVSFLANDADIVALRVAAADGGEPLTGDDPGGVIRRGAPLYFDWIDDDHVLLHVGVGTGAFLGEVERDGTDAGGALAQPGDFRSAEVSRDGTYVGYVRAAADAAAGAQIVVTGRDGGPEHTLPVFGPSAVSFSPTQDVLAVVGSDAAGRTDLAFPVGPLRTIDAETGETRTILDGLVVASFWSPDGRTLAALRLQVPSGTTAAAPMLTAATPSAAPTEVHALFVDVASAAIRSDRVVKPGSRLVSELLPYYDQYGLSHRLWAPDSSSFLLPVVAADGGQEVVALAPDGGPDPFTIGAPAAFWSP